MKTLRYKLVAIISGIMVSLVLIELTLRVAGFYWLYDFRKVTTPRENRDLTILTVGESTTAFGGEDSYPNILQDLLKSKAKVINGGMPGATTDEIYSAIKEKVSFHSPDIVVLMIGINDLIWGKGDKESPFYFISSKFKIFNLYRYIANGINLGVHHNSKFANRQLPPGKYRDVKYEKLSSKTLSLPKEQIETLLKYRRDGEDQKIIRYFSEREIEKNDPLSIPILINSLLKVGNISLAIDEFKFYSTYHDQSVADLLYSFFHYYESKGFIKEESYFQFKELLKLRFQEKRNEIYHRFFQRFLFHEQRLTNFKSEKKNKELENLFEDYFSKSGNYVYAHADYMFFLASLGRREKLHRHFELYREYYQAEVYYWHSYIFSSLQLGDAEESKDAIKAALKIFPGSPLITNMMRGLCAIDNGYCNESNLKKADASDSYLKSHSTRENYISIVNFLLSRKIKVVVMGYPLMSTERLKEVLVDFENRIEFVSNEENFLEAIKKHGREKIFVDSFAGSFGHASRLGNQVLAENLKNKIDEIITRN